jgi:hypothetical protein
MPRATNAYMFENKVMAFAWQLSNRLIGSDGDRGFVMLLTDSGSVRTIQFQGDTDDWCQIRDAARSRGVAYLFYDPFEPREYAWLEWHGIDQSTMERLIGASFEESDFSKSPHSWRAPDTTAYPTSWGVMF